MSSFEEFLSQNNVKWLNNEEETYENYPKSCVPSVLNSCSGRKAKKCMFEQLDASIYESSARMVAFKTSTQRVHPWIRAMWLFYYEYLGIQNSYDVKWSTEPASWRPTSKLQLKKIMTEVSKNEDSSSNENLTQFMITIYPTTGLIEVQGNAYQSFVVNDFPVLLKCVNKMINDQQFSSKDTNDPNNNVNIDQEETVLKTVQNKIVKNSDKIKSSDTTNVKESQLLKTLEQSTQVNDSTLNTLIQSTDSISILEDNCVKAIDKIETVLIKNVNEKLSVKTHTTALEDQTIMLKQCLTEIQNKQVNVTLDKKGQTSLETENGKLKSRIDASQLKIETLNNSIHHLRSDYELKLEMSKSEITHLRQDNQNLRGKLSGTQNDCQAEIDHLRYIIKKDTAKTIQELKLSPAPNVIVLHSLTNSLKDNSADNCVTKLDDIVQTTNKKWPSCKVVISLATVRKDKDTYNNQVHLVNALVRNHFIKYNFVSLCDNDNLATRGKPIDRFIKDDGFHLTDQGVARLASNIKRSCEEILNCQPSTKSSKKPYNYNNQRYGYYYGDYWGDRWG
ncbi:unnamed protein product [Mytilus coruscus]|uniref:SGNH hydrolase-type esterase domain-containing protein n=1 Tax=Mytilus coruscus TaxID=42192 RepID=A0A6J8B5J9_MYTCO|nr:unnamed protein product [Mytilus coruscus]